MKPSPLALGMVFKIVPDINPFIAGCQEGPGVQEKGPWWLRAVPFYQLEGKHLHFFLVGWVAIHVSFYFSLYCKKYMTLNLPF